jgi:hypothetical protein
MKCEQQSLSSVPRGGATLRLGGARGSPPKNKKKNKKNLKKIKILPQNLLFFLILAPPIFFFSIWPPQLGGAGSAPECADRNAFDT